MLLDIALAAVFVICVAFNAKKGFVKSAMGVLGFAAAVIIALNAGDGFGEYMQTTQMGRAAESKIYNTVYDKLYSASREGINAAEDALNLPSFIEKKIDFDDVYSQTYDKVSENVTTVIYAVVCKAVLFLLLSILFYIAKLIIPQMFKLPVLKQANGVLGAVFGVANGIFFVYIIMLVIYVAQNFCEIETLKTLAENSRLYAFAFVR